MTSQDKVLVRLKTERGAALSPVWERRDNAGSKSYYKQIIQQVKQGKKLPRFSIVRSTKNLKFTWKQFKLSHTIKVT